MGVFVFETLDFLNELYLLDKNRRDVMKVLRLNHVAVICSDIEASKKFYVGILGGIVIAEDYRQDRQSHKVSVQMPGADAPTLELFTFPAAPARLSYPEALGLRHLAFNVENVEQVRDELLIKGFLCEEIRTESDGISKFFFIKDPDELPIEFTTLRR